MAAALVWLFLPPSKPSAFAKIYFPPVPERMRFEMSDAPLKEQTQKELILSRMMLSKVVVRPDVAELASIKEQGDPVNWLARELAIELPAGSEIMKITLQGDRPEELQIIVNGVKNTYLQETSNEAENRRAERENLLALGLAKAEREYKAARDTLGVKNVGVGSADPQTIAFKQRRIEEQLDTAEGELKTATTLIKKLQRDLQLYGRKLNEPIDVKDSSYDPIFVTDDEVMLLTKQRKEAERKFTERKRLVAPDHPSLKDIENEVKIIQNKLDDRKTELRPFIETRVKQKLEADIAKAKEDLAAAEAQEQLALHKVERLKTDSANISSATLNVEGSHKDLLKLKAKVEEYELALEKLQNARETPQRARTMEEAIIVRPNEAARKSKVALGTLFGIFALTLLGFAFAEYRTRRIVSPDEVEHGLGVTVMGTVPSRPARVASLPSTEAAGTEQLLWEHLLTESIDSARTLFLHTADANALRVVMVTSALAGEGKSSLSCQLAKSLARSGRRVLLIDGDLRSPSLHTEFGLSMQPGVCEILRSEVPAAGVVRETAVPNLFLLTAGQCETRAVRQLAMDGFRKLIADVRGLYDFVLIDSSPVLPVADPLLMARHVDGVLLSLMCDFSQVERVQAACQKLASVGTRIIGAVIHGTSADTYGYGPRYLIPAKQ